MIPIDTQNLFENIPEQLPDELISILLNQAGLRLERIVSKGHSSATDFWYQQEQNEWMLLIQGQARLEFETPSRKLHLNAGDYLNIPANIRHRVDWTSSDPEAIWLCIFYSPIQEP
ncbi:cupin domain-containing protein [Motiliproteus sp. MSK22-1]|uniref:cupin domain-containing protein n=1 Tax=Motiliproteus sp. MSK22-1 TaxID=1897630 RepID=UPI000977503B|nr:cupin domain-containing protein [Motiliproteus sp. MSK22-1]OMH39100.1 hypothetical protein BGP75_05185 [Motiliproteus sp. MSK22-1]